MKREYACAGAKNEMEIANISPVVADLYHINRSGMLKTF
jgi:hypothetical protein